MRDTPLSDAAIALGEVATVPPPPGLHWLVVLMLCICTSGLFGVVWIMVQAIWVRKQERSNRVLYQLLAPYPIVAAGGVCTAATGIQAFAALAVIVGLGSGILAIFGMKSSLEDYGSQQTAQRVHLSGPLTFFFGTIYLQYHMNRIRSIQRQRAR